MNNITFGQAIEEIKNGNTVQRKGWNGKGMFIYLNEGNTPVKSLDSIAGIPGKLFNLGGKGTQTRLPNINMQDASGNTVTGWLASQADMLAEDWELVETA